MIYNEECLDWMSNQKDDTIDIIVSSPPYNINIKYNTYDDRKTDYIEWMHTVWNEACRILKPTGHLFLNIQPTRDNPLMPYQVVSGIDWSIQNTFIWNKCVEIDGYVRGQGNVVKSDRYLPNGWEFVFHLTKNGSTHISQERSGVPYQPEWAEGNAKRNGGRTWRPSVNTWFIPYETSNAHKSVKTLPDGKKHPAIYPRDLVSKCLKIADAQPGQVVYDPFGGTGTTYAVAQDFGCNPITTEIDSDYAEFIRQRCP